MTRQTRKSNFNAALIALHAGYNHSSLALASIAAQCNQKDFQVICFEHQVKAKPDTLIDQILAYQPNLIGFSTYLWNIEQCLRIARILKQLLPNSIILLGGPEAGPRATELLQTESTIDAIIWGEGEDAFTAIMRHLKSSGDLPQDLSGLYQRNLDGRVSGTGIALADLNQLTSPFAKGTAQTDRKLVYFETSRGCPFHCSFCTSGEERLRTYSTERILADLQQLRRLRDKTIKILDRSFHLGNKRTLNLLEAFVDSDPSLRFHLELNPDRISDEAVELFAKAPAGKFQFEIGLQTLNPHSLKNIHRNMNVDLGLARIRELIAIKKHQVHLDLIVGLPGDGPGECIESINRVFALHPHHLQLGMLKLLPGTELLRDADKWEYKWDRSPPYEILGHRQLSYSQLSQFKRYALLLERLWNSGLLKNTLAHLVNQYFDDDLCNFFDQLLISSDNDLTDMELQHDNIFGYLTHFIAQKLDVKESSCLITLVLWDYLSSMKLTQKTPDWIRDRIQKTQPVAAANNRRLPMLTLSTEVCAALNKNMSDLLDPGHYALDPQIHIAGRPLNIIPLNPVDCVAHSADKA